jgi:hypothetical protein
VVEPGEPMTHPGGEGDVGGGHMGVVRVAPLSCCQW